LVSRRGVRRTVPLMPRATLNCVISPPIGTGSRSMSEQLLATAPSRATPSNDQVVIFEGGVGGDDRVP